MKNILLNAALRLFVVSALLAPLGACRGILDSDNTDPAIKARLIHTLKGRPELDLKMVSIDVHVGVVTVSGLIPTEDDRRTIMHLARRVRGVRQVIVNLVVQN